MVEAIAFYEWCENMMMRRRSDNMWYRITNDPKLWPQDGKEVTDEEVWNKFKEDERNINSSTSR